MSDRQEEIVSTALRLISEQGIQELTMKKIAGAIGITEPALYRHFVSKFQILSAVIDRVAYMHSTIFKDLSEGGLTYAENIATFFQRHALLFTREPTMTAILFSEDLFRSEKALAERVASIMDSTMHTIELELRRGVESKAFRGDLDPKTATLVLVGGFRQLVSSWRHSSFGFPLEDRTKALIASALSLFSGI
jgi:AcrR family transcriptional regulator